MGKNNMQNKSVAVVVGTRPGIIKMAPTVRALEKAGAPHFIIHTGQHYSPEMDDVFMRDLGLYTNTKQVSGSKDKTTHGAKTAHMLHGVEEILIKEKPAAVLVCGDANTNLAAGLAARKLHMILGHVESGLRSFDWSMPEEHNRVMLDHISDLLFAATDQAAENLQRESVRGEIHVTGNTIVDAMFQHLDMAENKSTVLFDNDLRPDSYMILTTHREENVDNPDRLKGILEGVERVLRKYKMPIIFPMHPRTRKMITRFEYDSFLHELVTRGLRLLEPLSYLDFIVATKSARLVLTDSGGLQEEACILHVPTVTLRDNSERPETITSGTNMLAGAEPDRIEAAAQTMLSNPVPKGECPFGDGHAAERIIEITLHALQNGVQYNHRQL